MKNKLFLFLVLCTFCLTPLLRAQSWNPPVVIEAVEGTGAVVGKHSSLAEVMENLPLLIMMKHVRI